MAVGEAVAPAPSEPKPSGPPAGPPPTSLSVKVSGQKQLVVGETAQFFVEVTNKGPAMLRNVKVADRSDPAFDPTLATDGYQIENGVLTWIIDNLPAGKSVRYEIQCKCQTAAAKACNRASAALPDGTHAEDEACLEIRPPAAPPGPTPPKPVTPASEGLRLSVEGLSNPVRAGKELTYEIVVDNKGTASCRQVTVTATVPDGMVPDPLGTVGPAGPAAVKIDRQTVRFDPVPEVHPNESLTYRVRVRRSRSARRASGSSFARPQRPSRWCRRRSTEVIAQ